MKNILRLVLLPPAAAAFAFGFAVADADRLAPRRRSLFRRAVFALGVAGVVTGLALLSLGSYRYLDSGQPQVAQRAAPLTSRNPPGAVRGLSDGSAVVPASPTPSPTPAPGQRPPPLRDEPYHMVIDKAGVDAGVFTYGLDENRVPEVPLNPYDIAWYDFSAKPGTGSNAVFAGHVTWRGEAVFYRLDSVLPGDQVKLVGQDGTQLVYTVSDSYLVDPNDHAALSVMGPAQNDVITIITCGGTFYRTSDPVFGGDYTNRRVVRATLSSVNTVAAARPAASGG